MSEKQARTLGYTLEMKISIKTGQTTQAFMAPFIVSESCFALLYRYIYYKNMDFFPAFTADHLYSRSGALTNVIILTCDISAFTEAG